MPFLKIGWRKEINGNAVCSKNDLQYEDIYRSHLNVLFQSKQDKHIE